jgi:hypothetical protein
MTVKKTQGSYLDVNAERPQGQCPWRDSWKGRGWLTPSVKTLTQKNKVHHQETQNELAKKRALIPKTPVRGARLQREAVSFYNFLVTTENKAFEP